MPRAKGSTKLAIESIASATNMPVPAMEHLCTWFGEWLRGVLVQPAGVDAGCYYNLYALCEILHVPRDQRLKLAKSMRTHPRTVVRGTCIIVLAQDAIDALRTLQQ